MGRAASARASGTRRDGSIIGNVLLARRSTGIIDIDAI
jgi:hypothetical protein